MANDQHSCRYPWELKVDKTEVTEEGLKVEAHKEYDVNKILKMLEECINYAKTYSDEILYPSYTLNTYVTLASILDDAKGCIKQLTTKLEGVTHYKNALLNSRKANIDYINNLSKKVSKLEDDNDQLKYEVDALASQNQALSDENKKLEAKNAVLSDSNDRLNRVTEEALRENRAFSEKLEASEKENEELTEKLKQLTLKNEEITQNSKSLFEVLTCRSNALKDKLNVSEKKNEELAEKLRQSNETVEERIKDLLRTRVENEYLKNRLKYEIGVAFDNDIKALEEKLSASEAKIDKLRTTLDVTVEANAKLRRELKNIPEKNCINCDRYDVCMTVAERKARKANNYKPCSLWKKADEK